jgi:hypothetical protein
VNADSEKRGRRTDRASWIAAGFVFAFATSVLTVIYTGLMVEGSRADFDAGFRSVAMQRNEVQAVRFVFDSPVTLAEARLELDLPDMLRPVGATEAGPWQRTVSLVPGSNEFSVELRAVALGSGYVIARVSGEDPIGRDSVFVTVTGEEPPD